jgi:phage shock protein PspC (stress-responsive transcriptional regulator)
MLKDMNLTQRQETMVAQFLHQSDRAVSDLSPVARAQTLQQIKNRLHSELHTLKKDITPSDVDVAAVLLRCKVTATGWQQPLEAATPPAVQPQSATRQGEPPSDPRARAKTVDQAPVVVQTEEGAQWLGVCMYLAGRIGQDVRLVRGLFIILGLLTGPGALIAYLALYAEWYFSGSTITAPKPDRERLVQAIIATLGMTVGLFILGLVASFAAHGLYGYLVGGALILGQWGWLDARAGLLFIGALFSCVPLATLGALPMQNKWDITIARFAKLGVALYAAVVCMGVASIVVRTALLCVLELKP